MITIFKISNSIHNYRQFPLCKAIFSIVSKSIYHFLMSSLTHWGDMSNLITLSFINISMPQMLGNLSQYSANLQLRHVQWTFLPEISHMNSTSPAGVKSHKEYNNYSTENNIPKEIICSQLISNAASPRPMRNGQLQRLKSLSHGFHWPSIQCLLLIIVSLIHTDATRSVRLNGITHVTHNTRACYAFRTICSSRQESFHLTSTVCNRLLKT